jgi:hypothetical protein
LRRSSLERPQMTCEIDRAPVSGGGIGVISNMMRQPPSHLNDGFEGIECRSYTAFNVLAGIIRIAGKIRPVAREGTSWLHDR